MVNLRDKDVTPRHSQTVDVGAWVWLLAVPLLGAFYVTFQGRSWLEIVLTFGSGLLLSSVIGLRETWTTRHPVAHEQSHLKLTTTVTLVLWSVFVVGIVVVGLARGKTDRLFWEHIVVLSTLGSGAMVLLGVMWGIGLRTMDWYPLRRKRASVMRVIGLYLLELALVVILSIGLIKAPLWQWFLGLTGVLLVWLVVARLWRG